MVNVYMAIQRTHAFVLKRDNFRETSLIARFYTRDFGKLSGLMKGIRQEPAKFASTVEPFSLNEIIFYEKRNSSLHLISQCDVMDIFSGIRSDLFRVGVASLMMEFLDAVMPPEDANTEVFDLTLSCLRELSAGVPAEKILTIFKIKILSLSGFKPNFDSCVSCGARISGPSKFSLALGGLLCPSCFRKDLRARSIFRGTVASIVHIEKNDFKNTLNLGLNPQIKKELDLVLGSFLTFHLEREFRAERVMQNMQVAYAGR